MNSFNKHTQMTSVYPLALLIHLDFMFFLLINVIQFPLASQGCHEEERRALLDFKSSFEGPPDRLSSWQESSKNCCSWHGIGCSSDSFHVIKIDLRNKDHGNYDTTALRGTISSSLFKITHLEYLDLGWNNFNGSVIPFQFSNLTKLTHLDLSSSMFSSSISTQFANLSSLQYLDLSCRYIEPYISISSMKWVRQLVNLKVLRLMNVNLSEATSSGKNFGEHISHLSNLRDLDLSECNIENPVFHIQKFHNLSNLYSLKMNNNYNSINYNFPLNLDNLTSLSILELSSCDLQGSTPYLPQLIELDVSWNVHFRVNLTKMFEHHWPKLQKLSLDGTRVEGSVPISIWNAPLLVRLSSSYCSIQGSLPSSIYNLSRLEFLDFSNNNITGHIQPSISNLKNLSFLDLSGNNFQGSIPKSICENFRLQELSLSYNNISGSVPSCVIKLRNLNIFDVFNNSIEGKIPLISWINELNLTQLNLGANRLTVTIDQELPISQFQLQSLELRSCHIRGPFPIFICNLTHLNSLDLADNDLTRIVGDVPSCVYRLGNLNLLNSGLFGGPQPPPGPPLLGGPQPPPGLPPQYNYAQENVLFYGDVALGFIVGFWGLFFSLLLSKKTWWCKYWRFADTVAVIIVRECRQIIYVCKKIIEG